MKQKIFWIIALVMGNFYSSAQAQTGSTPVDPSRSFARCLTFGECWEADQHPNFFELDRVAPALKKFLTPADYRSLVNNQNVMLQLLTEDSRLHVLVGFCPPQTTLPNGSLWDCDRMMFVSFSWDKSIEEILGDYNSNKGPSYQSSSEAIVKEVLGQNGQGGKLKFLMINSSADSTEAFYWQEGMAEKKSVKWDTESLSFVREACTAGPDEPVTDCRKGLVKMFTDQE
ncbi:MAG TPA: hypothetical protein PK803_05765 [Alphaproteobacteria bacterium]|nr:hypothetical protein [Alphaproteobacteria bacterium]